MGARPLDVTISQAIIADWRTGAYSQQDLAVKHKVSKGVVNKLCKGVAQDTLPIVAAGIDYRLGLAGHDDRNVTAINAVVDERTRHIQFFNNAAIKNVSGAVNKINEGTTITEHRMLADVILKGKETVLGKSPDTAVQINNNPGNGPDTLTNDERAARTRERMIQELGLLGGNKSNCQSGD